MLAGMTTSSIIPPVVNRHQADKLLIQCRTPLQVPLVIKGAASQSGDLQQWQYSDGTVLGKFTYGGALIVGTTGDSAGVIQGKVNANNSSQVVSGIYGDARGNVNAVKIAVYGYTLGNGGYNFAVVGTAYYGGGGTNCGGYFNSFINGVASSQTVPGNCSLAVDSITSSGTTAYFMTGGTAFMTLSGSASQNCLIASSGATKIPLVVQGAASQSANLQQWRNSSGTVGACVNSSLQFSNAGGGGGACEVFGAGAAVYSTASNCTAIGNAAVINSGGWDSSTAIGASAAANTNWGTAVGQGASASAGGATVLGKGSSASASFAVTIGAGSGSGYAGSIVLGGNTSASAANQFVVGAGSGVSGGGGITDVYIGGYVTGQAGSGNAVVNAFPVSTVYHATGGSGSNIAGGSIGIAGGQGTGTGVGGNITLQVAPAGSTGSSLNALSTIVTVSPTTQNVLIQSSGATLIPLVVQGATSQSADLQQWQTSTGSKVLGVNSSGSITWYSSGSSVATASVGGGSLLIVLNSATYQFNNNSAASLISNGTSMGISNSQGGYVSSVTCTGNTTGSVVLAVANTTVLTTSLTTQNVLIQSSGATLIPLVVKGAASQSGNLFQCNDSSSNILYYIKSDGGIYSTVTAVASTAETLMKLTISDNTSSYIQIVNASSTDSTFLPTLEGVQSGTGTPLGLTATGTTDTGTNPLILITARISGGVDVATRPLLQLNNRATPILKITAGNNWQFTGSTISPTLAGASADTVSMAAVDDAAGDRRWHVQSEMGSAISLGNDRLDFAGTTAAISRAGTDLLTLGNAAMGFYGVTPITRQVLATGAGHSVDDIITLLQSLGLCKQS